MHLTMISRSLYTVLLVSKNCLVHHSTQRAWYRFSIDTFAKHCSKLSLFLSSQKCKSVLFTFRPFNPIVANVKYKNHYFEALNHFKYLGIILDSKLTWKYHIEHLQDRAFNATNILKSLTNKMGREPIYSNSVL